MAKKFLDLTGLQQVWSAILTKETALQTSIDKVKNSIAFSAKGYADALTYATSENVGKIVMVASAAEGDMVVDGKTYAEGPYVITGVDSISFLATSSGDVAGDELEALKGRVTTVEGKVATLSTNVDTLTAKDQELSDAITNGLAEKVDAVDGYSLVSDDDIIKLSTVAEGAQVNVIETVKVNGTALTVTDKAVDITIDIPEAQVTGIASDDKVLSLNGGLISSTLSYVRESVDGVDSLVLKGKDSNVLGSIPVADFVADGMLKNVEHKDNKLIFTFNVDVDAATGDDKKVIEVDLAKYIDAYTAGTGISISDNNEISVVNPFTTDDKAALDKVVDDVANLDFTPFATKEEVANNYVAKEGFNPFTAEDKAALDKVVGDVANIDLTPFATKEEVAETYITKDDVANSYVAKADFNPFTTDDKANLDALVIKMANIEDNAQANKIESVVFGSIDLVDENKVVDLSKIFATSLTETEKGITVEMAVNTFLKKDEVDSLSTDEIDSVLNPVQE